MGLFNKYIGVKTMVSIAKNVVPKVTKDTKIQKAHSPTVIKDIKKSVTDLIGISKQENQVLLSRREESHKLMKLLGVQVHEETGIDDNPNVKSMAVMAEKFPEAHKAIKRTMFKEWCSLVDSKNNKGSDIKNGNVVIKKKTYAINFENLFGDENKIKILKLEMSNNPDLKDWVMEEKDKGHGTGLKVQYKKWENKEYNKIKNSLKPESNIGTGTSAITPATFYDKKIANPLSNILALFKKEQGTKFDSSTINHVNDELGKFEKELKKKLKEDKVYELYLTGVKIS